MVVNAALLSTLTNYRRADPSTRSRASIVGGVIMLDGNVTASTKRIGTDETLAEFSKKWRRIADPFLAPVSKGEGNEPWYDRYMHESGRFTAFRRMLTALPFSFGGKQILDITCATGETALVICKCLAGNTSYTGLTLNDPSPKFLAKAREKLAASHLANPLSLDLGFTSRFLLNPDGTKFDVVLWVGSFNFATPEDITAISSLAFKHLVCGGSFVVIDANRWQLSDDRIPQQVAKVIAAERERVDFNRFVLGVREQQSALHSSNNANFMELQPIALNGDGSQVRCFVFQRP